MPSPHAFSGPGGPGGFRHVYVHISPPDNAAAQIQKTPQGKAPPSQLRQRLQNFHHGPDSSSS